MSGRPGPSVGGCSIESPCYCLDQPAALWRLSLDLDVRSGGQPSAPHACRSQARIWRDRRHLLCFLCASSDASVESWAMCGTSVCGPVSSQIRSDLASGPWCPHDSLLDVDDAVRFWPSAQTVAGQRRYGPLLGGGDSDPISRMVVTAKYCSDFLRLHDGDDHRKVERGHHS